MSKNKKLVPKRRFKAFQNADAWEQRELGDLAEIVRGASPRPIQNPKWFNQNSEIGWLRISDVTEQNGRIHFLEQRISEAGQGKTRVLHSSHLLLSIAATVGKPVINYVPTGVHDGFLIFLNPKFDLEFMFQCLEMFRPQWQKYGQPGSQVNLNSDLVKNQKIFIPSLGEQKEISSFFTNLDQTIAFQQRKLEKMKSMKSAYLSEMFPAEGERKPKRRFPGFTDDWEQRELGEIVNWSKGDKLSKEKLNESGNGEPVIHYANLYKFSPVIYDVINWSTSNEGRLIPDNSLLFPMSDVTPVGLARTSTITKSGVKAGGDTLIGTVDDFYSAQFVSYFINANSNKILPLVTGTTVRHISANSLSKLEILLPDIKEQQKISDFLNSIQETIAFQQQKLEKLQNIKKAYLNEMFI